MRNLKKNKKLKGFSLFELLVTIGVLLMLSAIVFPFTLQKVQMSKLESHVSQLTTDLYFQQQEGYYKNTPHGIAVDSNGYTIFVGEDLLTATEKEEKTYPANVQIHSINFNGGNGFHFPAGEFKPSNSGTMVLTDGFNSIRVYINSEGLIDYEIL